MLTFTLQVLERRFSHSRASQLRFLFLVSVGLKGKQGIVFTGSLQGVEKSLDVA
jgi:hypothetical protein